MVSQVSETVGFASLGTGPIQDTFGGEIAVEIGLRSNRKSKSPIVWVSGCTNDVMACIANRRTWREGGGVKQKRAGK